MRDKLHQQLRDWIHEMDAAVPGLNSHYDPAQAFETTRVKPEWVSTP
ncbi:MULTISPECIES: hypothetical protein [Pirellulaceae]|nr:MULTISPECIES: hypothetical protein [Pirellulaceae]